MILMGVGDQDRVHFTHAGEVRQLELRLDTHEHLPPPPETSKEGASCAGGVHVISTDGKIVCNNSLDDRLKVAFERNVPEIRATIFGANPNIHVKV